MDANLEPDIDGLEAKREQLLDDLRLVTRQIVQARTARRKADREAKDARIARIGAMAETMTIEQIGRAEGLSTTRTHVLLREAKRRKLVGNLAGSRTDAPTQETSSSRYG